MKNRTYVLSESLTCIAFSIEKHREILLASHQFLALICSSLSAKIRDMTDMERPHILSWKRGRHCVYSALDIVLKAAASFHPQDQL